MNSLLMFSVVLNVVLMVLIFRLGCRVNKVIDMVIAQLEELKATALKDQKEYDENLSQAIAEKLVELINKKRGARDGPS